MANLLIDHAIIVTVSVKDKLTQCPDVAVGSSIVGFVSVCPCHNAY